MVITVLERQGHTVEASIIIGCFRTLGWGGNNDRTREDTRTRRRDAIHLYLRRHKEAMVIFLGRARTHRSVLVTIVPVCADTQGGEW